MTQSALDLGVRGYWVAPLCHPTQDLRCGCGRQTPHNGRDIGKAPVTQHGIRDSVNTTREIWEFWNKYPNANIAIDLQRSGLLGIGPDSPEWLTRFQEWGLPETMLAKSGGGDGHRHYYYRRPEGCPVSRLNRSGEYDIQSDGHFVAPPSVHPSGNPYTWLTPLQYAADLPEAPAWAVKMLKERVQERDASAVRPATGGLRGDCPVRLTGRSLDWWEGRSFASLPGGGIDRSRTLFTIGLILAGANATEGAITQALEDRDHALGYAKYADRRDRALRYSEIAQRVLAIRGVETLTDRLPTANLAQVDLVDYVGRFTEVAEVEPGIWQGKCPILSEPEDTFQVYQSVKGWVWTCSGRCARWGDVLTLARELKRARRM